ncbi:MAG: antifreeze protein [Proteobacteria bacterium]|nr:MAG: antifreeze protein [Pseudomonadota bacterium]PIE17532.1 MAG: antifreeze protein [Pseudomonadota bacterium]
MGILDFVKKGVSEMMIARPPETKGLIIYKHPDPTIPMKSQLTVDQDDVALFFRDGKIVGLVQPGRHTMDSSNIPFLSNLVDSFTGGNVLKAEVYFVTVREMPNFKFGGRIGAVEDPKSGIPVETMVHGSYSLRVTDPQKLVIGLVGMSADNNDAFVKWFRDLLLKVMKDRIAELLVKKKWPLLDVTSGAYTEEIETEVLEGIKRHVDDYGLSILRIGNFNIAINDEDSKNLKKLYTDAAYVRMAGGMQGYQQFAGGKAMMGAGEGMAKGGGGGGGGGALLGGAGLGVGFGMAGMMQQSMAPQQPQYQQQQAPPPMQQGPANPFGAPPPASSVQFHIHFNNQQMGPYGVDVLQQGVQSGQFTAETPVWKQGMAAWTPAGQVPELAHLFGGDDGAAPPPFGAPPAGGPPPAGGGAPPTP